MIIRDTRGSSCGLAHLMRLIWLRILLAWIKGTTTLESKLFSFFQAHFLVKRRRRRRRRKWKRRGKRKRRGNGAGNEKREEKSISRERSFFLSQGLNIASKDLGRFCK